MYCTECIIGIIQNAGTPSRLRFAHTRRDEGRHERQASNYGSPFLHTTEARSFVASKYCESTPRSQVNLSHDSFRARRAVGRACALPLGSATDAFLIPKSLFSGIHFLPLIDGERTLE
jgi:hypothetical protein